MPNFKNAREGDRVWGIQGNEKGKAPKATNGKISLIKTAGEYPVRVTFDGGREETYTFEGLYYVGNCAPSLFWSRPEWSDPPPPKRMVKKTVFLNLYPEHGGVRRSEIGVSAYLDEEAADDFKNIQGIRRTVEIEVEE